jgi:MFS transporter, YNFM family, putative membrane transport protein
VKNRRITSAIVLAGFCAFAGFYATQPILPLLARVFHASAVGVSLTITAATAGVALAAPAIGTIADRLGRKRVIVVSAGLLSVATAMCATANTLPALVAWRFLQGVFTPGVFAITVAYIHEEWPRESVGSATAAYVTGTVIGGFSGRVISGAMTERFDWHLVFLALGILNALGTLALWSWLPRETNFIRARQRAPWRAAIGHLRNSQLLATYAVGFCVLFSLVATFTYVTFYLAAPPFHLGAAALGSIFFVYLIGAVVTPAAGKAIDRYSHRTALAVAVAAGAGGVLLTLGPRLYMVIAGLAICCTGVFIAQASASSYIGVAARGNRALAVGLYVTFYYAGGSAGAAIPGFLWQAGGWPACVALIVAVQLLTVGMALRLWADTPAHAEFDESVLAS